MTSTKQNEKHRSEDNRTRVLVTVRGGVTEAFYDESKVMVEIFDYDEYAAKGKEPESYLDDLVQDWDFPDPREASPGAGMCDTPVESRCKVQRLHPNYEGS